MRWCCECRRSGGSGEQCDAKQNYGSQCCRKGVPAGKDPIELCVRGYASGSSQDAARKVWNGVEAAFEKLCRRHYKIATLGQPALEQGSGSGETGHAPEECGDCGNGGQCDGCGNRSRRAARQN